jgi:hypothetical protein
MEKETITIEIKQEVSITLLWITAGVILVSAAFFLTPQAMEMWPAVNAAGVVTGIYLVTLLAYVLRRPLPMRPRIVVGVAAAVMIACSVFSSMRMQDQTRWQASQLMKIRAVIGRGMRMAEMPQILLKTLDSYHRQGTTRTNTLAGEFTKMCPGAAVGSNIHKSEGDWDKMAVMVETLDADRIELVSQETFVPGRDPSFKNFNGQTGMLQEKFILTERGLTHVSEN